MNINDALFILDIEVHIDGDTITLDGTPHVLPGGDQLTYRRLLVRHETDGAWRFDRASGSGMVVNQFNGNATGSVNQIGHVNSWGVHQ